jgi:outer membrane lipoprotein SlyB
MAETTEGGSMMNKIASIGTSGPEDEATHKNKATISGAAVGGLFGMYYGYSKEKNMLVCGIVGSVIGAVVARVFTSV